MVNQLKDQELFQSIFESTAQGILVVDEFGIILRANQALENIFGYPTGELVNKKLAYLIPQNQKAFHQNLQNQYSNSSLERAIGKIEVCGLKKNGKQISLDISLNPTELNGKKIVIAFVSDNTERILNKSTNVLDEECMLEVQRIAHVGSWTWNLKTNERFWSDEFYRICGLQPGDARINRESAIDFIHPDDREMVIQKINEAIEKKTPYAYEKRIITANGDTKHILSRGKIIYNSQGEALQIRGTLQDVTTLKLVSLELEQEKKILNKYLDTAASIILVINKQHIIELINKKGSELLSQPQNEIIGKNWFNNFIPKPERKEMKTFFDNIIKNEFQPPDAFENWIITKNNEKRLIRWRNAILKDAEGENTGIISTGVDITEQIVLEQELRASEEKNRAIITALPDIITINDEKGTFLDIQSEINLQLPYPFKELKDMTIEDFVSDPDECQKILNAHTKVIKTKKMEIIEVPIQIANKNIDFEARIVPFGKDKVLAVLRDISKSKSTQNILNIRNRALNAAGNGIIIVDAQQPILPIIYCNTAFTELTGYSREEIIGMNCQFLQNDDRDQNEIGIMSEAIKKGEACRVVLRNYRKDGSLFWNDLSITPLLDENKNLTHFIGVQNDVTERIENKKALESYAEKLEETIEKRTTELKSTVEKLIDTNINLENQVLSTKAAEQKARASQEMFTAIAKNFPKGVIIVFNQDLELVYLEGEELDRFRIKKSALESAQLDELAFLTAQQKSKLKDEIKSTLNGQIISSEIDFLGQSYTVNSTPLVGDSNTIIWALFVFHNVTSQKQVQQKLEASLKAEQELNELKSRFISMASHEFRTPLSAILSSAILIGKQNEAGKEERRMKHVFRIRQNVKNLVVILNDFLSLSKLEEGKIKAIPKSFELIEFVKLAIDEMEATRKDGQNIIIESKESRLTVFLDPKLLSHILINLLSNAIKYSDANQNILIKIIRTNTHFSVIIIDNGIGIPEAEQKNLFQRFYRAENATNIQGTGLGLHIVKQYVDLMEGNVDFKSEVGKGTSFKVELPITMMMD